MDKLKESLNRIFGEGPEPKDLPIVFGLLVACIVIIIGTLWSALSALVYFVVGIFTLNFLKLVCGFIWCIVLAFFIAIIIIACSWIEEKS